MLLTLMLVGGLRNGEIDEREDRKCQKRIKIKLEGRKC
jgi:hypothetical protein